MVTLPPPQPRHHTFRQPELEGEQGQRQIHGATLGHTDPRGKRRLEAVGEDPGVQGALGIGGALWIAPHPSSGPSSPAHVDGDAVLTPPRMCAVEQPRSLKCPPPLPGPGAQRPHLTVWLTSLTWRYGQIHLGPTSTRQWDPTPGLLTVL